MDTIVTPVTVITLDSTRIVHSIKADLVARYFPPVVRLVQYDQSLPVIAVSLMQNGQEYTLPSGAAANIRVHKPDATYVYNPALGCDSTRKIVYFEVTQAMAAASGDGLAIVEIVVDGDIAGTSLITLHFEENPVPEDAIESSDEWETIYELGERIIASTVTPVSTAAGMTDHNVVYLYTGTESGWNQGHMYYYNGTTWVDAGIAVTDTTLSVAGLAADAKKTGDEIADLKDGFDDLKEELRGVYSVNETNLCPTPTASTVNGGYLNGSTGTYGTVEAGKTYTFSATNLSDVGKNVGIRIFYNGAWANQANVYSTPSARFNVTFTATVDGDISLNAFFGTDYDPIFKDIQLEEGSVATGYTPYHYTTYTAVDKSARDDIFAKSIISDCTITDGKYYGNGKTAGQSLSVNSASGYYTMLIPVEAGKEYTLYVGFSSNAFCYFAKDGVVVKGFESSDYDKNGNVVFITIPLGANQIAFTGLDSALPYSSANVINKRIVDIIPTKTSIPSGMLYPSTYQKSEINDMLGMNYIVNKIYVATTGNDTTGDGTKDNPYATIYHAYETITDNTIINRYEVIVADGTYTDLQTRYSGITGTSYQGVMSKDYVSVKSESGNPDNCVLEWDGATGFETFTEADATYKCFFHLNDHAVGVTIEGIKFVGANLRYCLHFETNRESSVEINNCYFDWAGVYSASDDHKNRPVIGMGGSYFQNVTFKKCRFCNSQNTAGVQWHDNVPYKTYDYPLGGILHFEDCYFDGLNIQVRSYNYDRSKSVFALELVRCSGLNIVYPTIASGSVNYWRLTDDSNRIVDNKMFNCTDATTFAEQTVVK